MLQVNVRNNNPEYNRERLIATLRSAPPVDLLAAPSEALLGPDPGEFLASPDFRSRLSDNLAILAEALRGYPPLICGVQGRGALLISGGMILDLPDAYSLNGISVGFVSKDNENEPPKTDILFDLRSVPYAPYSQEKREKRALRIAENAALCSPSIVGGYGQWVYNGQSLAILPGAIPVCRGAAFEEDFVVVDLNSPNEIALEDAPPDIAQWRALALGTRDFARKLGASRVVIGLSGGMDSALVACAASEALGPENVVGVLMPSPWSSDGSVTDSETLASNLGIKTSIAPIEAAMSAFDRILAKSGEELSIPMTPLALENLQARIRGVILMAIANSADAIVLNTGNKSEIAMGYSTLYGDSVGALAVIGDIYKTRVYELARAYNARNGEIIPRSILEKAPSAELRPDQKDTDSLPPYDQLDPVLEKIFERKSLTREEAEIRKRVVAAGFKRAQSPPPLLVGGESLRRWESF